MKELFLAFSASASWSLSLLLSQLAFEIQVLFAPQSLFGYRRLEDFHRRCTCYVRSLRDRRFPERKTKID